MAEIVDKDFRERLRKRRSKINEKREIKVPLDKQFIAMLRSREKKTNSKAVLKNIKTDPGANQFNFTLEEMSMEKHIRPRRIS